MYVRFSTFQINAGRIDEYRSEVEKLKPQVMELPGIKYWFSAADDNGSCASIAVYEDEEAAIASSSGAGAAFGQLADFMETEPDPQGLPVFLYGTKP